MTQPEPEPLAYSPEMHSMSLPVRQLIVNNPTVHAIWTVANRERWDLNRFLQECLVAVADQNEKLVSEECRRAMMAAPAGVPR